MTYEVFTKNLSQLKSYKKMKKELKNDLDIILYDMTGVKGVRYDSIPMSFNPSLSALKSLEMVEKYEDKLREYNWVCMSIEEVEKTLEGMPEDLQTMLKEKFVKGITFEKLGMKYGYSNHGLWCYMKRETEKFL